jgi:hypothetical protein
MILGMKAVAFAGRGQQPIENKPVGYRKNRRPVRCSSFTQCSHQCFFFALMEELAQRDAIMLESIQQFYILTLESRNTA